MSSDVQELPGLDKTPDPTGMADGGDYMTKSGTGCVEPVDPTKPQEERDTTSDPVEHGDSGDKSATTGPSSCVHPTNTLAIDTDIGALDCLAVS